MAKSKPVPKKEIEQYEHKGKERLNNPPVGLVTPDTDKLNGKTKYQYDWHLDPQLVWSGKAERTSFEVPRISLHVHERIDPRSIIAAARSGDSPPSQQRSLFDFSEENPPLREAIEFYKHKHNWSNRLIAGDSLLVMNSLLQKEGMAGQVQMVYMDPPYGIDYASNFQPFTNNRTVRDRDEDLTQEPEMIKAFRDTWALGIHSYLSHLRDRLLLAKELLAPTGSIFLQIGIENVHLARAVLDEVFGQENFVSQIIFRKKMMPLSKKPGCESMTDYILWYAKSKEDAEKKFKQVYLTQETTGNDSWGSAELPEGKRRELTPDEVNDNRLLPKGSRIYQTISNKPREYRANQDFNFEFKGTIYPPPGGDAKKTPDGVHCWSTTQEGMERLALARRLEADGNTLRYVLFHDDYPVMRLTSLWSDTAPATGMRYVVETSPLVVQRCMLMATDPGDLVLDPTCGSGTTAFVAEQWGRRWITCDSSRVSTALARQRLMTATFPYYKLKHPDEGVSSGFDYETVPHVTRGDIANNPEIKKGVSYQAISASIRRFAKQETLYDEPEEDSRRARVSGPFTVEAVPAPTVRPVAEIPGEPPSSDISLGRSGETQRQDSWREELLKDGVRGKGGQRIAFSRLEIFGGTRWLHVDGETKEDTPQRVVVSFGPEFAPLEQRQVALALEEAQALVPKPRVVAFAAFQFDPEAAKDIDETKWPGVTLLKIQMSADLFTDDLKKERTSNESFWLVGQPDAHVAKIKEGPGKGQYEAVVNGFDYYNTKTGTLESGGKNRIAMWLLDTDYDGRSMMPRQVFFPLANPKHDWTRLAKTLKAEIDLDLIEAYRGTKSLPFKRGKNGRVAVKIVDDRGVESLKIIEVE